MTDITKAFQWAVQTCNTDNIGYSQDYRNQQKVGDVTYYDCSSFIWYALLAGGFDVATQHGSDYPFTTSNMGSVLLKLGFTEVTVSGEWKPGDILVRLNEYGNHTEMVHHGRITMGAKSSSYDLEKQVSISTSDSIPATWDTCYRYGDGASFSYSWIVHDTDQAGTMSEADQQNNVMIIFSELTTKYGWTLEAIAGVLGSMQIESYFNPGQWELGRKTETPDGYGYGYGYGLIQWTRPSSDYPNPYLYYCGQNNIDRLDGSEQLRYLNEGINDSNLWGWIKTNNYPESFEEYIKSKDTPEYLALVWFYNLERPPASDTTKETRQQWARYWYDWLEGKDPIFPGTDIEKKKAGLTKLLLFAIATDRF